MEDLLLAPEHVDILTEDGRLLRVVYEMSIGDLLICSVLLLLLVYLLIKTVLKITWRW